MRASALADLIGWDLDEFLPDDECTFATQPPRIAIGKYARVTFVPIKLERPKIEPYRRPHRPPTPRELENRLRRALEWRERNPLPVIPPRAIAAPPRPPTWREVELTREAALKHLRPNR